MTTRRTTITSAAHIEMPHQTTSLTPRQKRAEKAERAWRILAGGKVGRDDSDDELGTEDLPWEWIYEQRLQEPENGSSRDASDDSGEESKTARTPRKRRSRKISRSGERKIIGARMGSFECKIGDTVLLKADGSNAAWVGIIWEFMEDEDREKSANFLCKRVRSENL